MWSRPRCVCRKVRENRAVVFAAGQLSKPRPHPGIAGGKLALANLGELANESDAVAGEPLLHRHSDAPQQRDRFTGEKRRGLTAAEYGKAARLVEVGGDLCEKLVVAQSDRHSNAMRGFNPLGEPGEELGGAGAVHSFC